jgi:hypothetical protein
MTNGSLVAWIERRSSEEFEAAYVAEAASRTPATRTCTSAEDARRWIESEAAFVSAPVKWLDAAPALRH